MFDLEDLIDFVTDSINNNKENYPPRPFTPTSTKLRTLPLQSYPSCPQYEHSPSTNHSH